MHLLPLPVPRPFLAGVALAAIALPCPAEGPPDGDPHAWTTTAVGWKDAASGRWAYAEPWTTSIAAAVAADSVEATRGDTLAALAAVAEAVDALAGSPGAFSGTIARTSGGATATAHVSVEPDFWSDPPAGAAGNTGVFVNASVTGLARPPVGSLSISPAGPAAAPALDPADWVGTAPAEVVLRLVRAGTTAPVVTRSDGGPFSVAPAGQGEWVLTVPMASAQRAVVIASGTAPGGLAGVGVAGLDARSWRVRSPSGAVALASPATSSTAAPEAGTWILEGEGVAGITRVLATADGFAGSPVPYRLRGLLLAAPPAGNPPVLLVSADPQRAPDPLRSTVRWLSAGATSVVLQPALPGGIAEEIGPAGTRLVELPWRLASGRDALTVGFMTLRATGPGGSTSATTVLVAEPVPTRLAVERVAP